MKNNTSSEANPFRKIEITIVVVFSIWILAILGWFVSNNQISAKEKLVTNAEIFLEENTVKIEVLDCTVDQSEESGKCQVTTENQKMLVVECPIKSVVFDFARVFFVKGQPCEFIDSQ